MILILILIRSLEIPNVDSEKHLDMRDSQFSTLSTPMSREGHEHWF